MLLLLLLVLFLGGSGAAGSYPAMLSPHGSRVESCLPVVRFNAYQISASIDAKNNGFTRELRCPPVLIYFTQACREAGVRLVQVTLKDWTLNAFRRNASSAGWP